MTIPIGEVLVKLGFLSGSELEELLELQRQTGRPLGELAETHFGLSPRQVEQAWAEQYAGMTRQIDPTLEHVDPAVLTLISRRQAWQFRVLPMRYEGSQLVLCTTREHLIRAHNFATSQVAESVCFELSDSEPLGQALLRHYPMDGMTPRMVARSGGSSEARRSCG